MSKIAPRFCNSISWLTLVGLALCAQAGCATASGIPVQFDRLVFENVSPDVVRVFIHMGDRELLLGRVEAMSRAELRIRAGVLPPGRSAVRVLVLVVGSPSPLPMSALSAGALSSDSYPLSDLMGQIWRYSGSRIQPVGPSTRQ